MTSRIARRIIGAASAAGQMTLVDRAVDRVAQVASGYEARWTLAALRRIAPELHEALVDQQRKWHDTLIAKVDAEVHVHTDAMVRGWQAAIRTMEAANAAAEEDGGLPCLVGMHQDTVVAVAENSAAAQARVEQRFPGQRAIVVTPDEVAAMVVGLGDVALQVKELWPGAAIVGISERKPEPEWQPSPVVPPDWMQRVHERDKPIPAPPEEGEYAAGDGDMT